MITQTMYACSTEGCDCEIFVDSSKVTSKEVELRKVDNECGMCGTPYEAVFGHDPGMCSKCQGEQVRKSLKRNGTATVMHIPTHKTVYVGEPKLCPRCGEEDTLYSTYTFVAIPHPADLLELTDEPTDVREAVEAIKQYQRGINSLLLEALEHIQKDVCQHANYEKIIVPYAFPNSVERRYCHDCKLMYHTPV